MLLMLLLVGLYAGAAMPDTRLLDPRVLEPPVGHDDPLAVLKQLWRRGARGPLFEVDARYGSDCGAYLAVENWAKLRPHAVDGITFLTDPAMLARMQDEAAAGLRIIVHNRVPNGGFAVNTDNTFYGLAAALVPALGEGPYVGVNGYTNLYLFEHELVHHADHVSGFSDHLWAEIQGTLAPLKTEDDLLEPVYFFIVEARAQEVEFSMLEAATRAVEVEGTADDDERTRLSFVDGPAMRRRRIVDVTRAFNDCDRGKLLGYAPRLRAAAREFFRAYIPDFETRFDAEDRMRSR